MLKLALDGFCASNHPRRLSAKKIEIALTSPLGPSSLETVTAAPRHVFPPSALDATVSALGEDVGTSESTKAVQPCIASVKNTSSIRWLADRRGEISAQLTPLSCVE
jgi:hypothetical protein